MHILFVILLTVQIIICIAMIGLILLQRSEGGALGMGGGPSGLVSARGAGNLLTKTTSILGVAFFVNCIALTYVGQQASGVRSVVDQVGSQNITLTPGAPAKQPQAQQQSSSASSAQPSLTELPRPAAQVAPTPAPAASQPSASVPSPQDSLNSLKALDRRKDAIMGSGSASSVAPPPQIPLTPPSSSSASASKSS